ncbi:aldehyde dehydrogenase family protein [Rhodococcus opacus]|uniref:aldehyde dehydrogenase family protein n=1 Tax=Rhodococcus opacus TaxID=37919 RepID=UPI001C440968|nr:aldehyde dehydrogenase family protein [Rhodococcus opacus]MBV6759086.1 aldehyde dehydrogenase family protein [Rhodococcus opacus]
MSTSLHPAQSARVNQELDLRIGGTFERGAGETFPVHNPATEEIIAEVAAASPAQIERATAIARSGLDRNEMGDAKERSAALDRLAEVFEAHAEEILAISVNEIGTPVSTARGLHVDTPISVLRWMAQGALTDRTERLGVFDGPPASDSIVIHRPAGVIAGIAAYNYPLLFAAIKVGAAYAAGCPSVLLSSPNAPLGILNFGRYAQEAGWPESAVSVLAGGVDVAQHLISRPEVAKVSFTGSVPAGKAVMTTAAEGLRDVVLELGGKSAAIVLPTADVEAVVEPIHSRYLRNAGQGCASPTRILLHRPQLETFLAASRTYFDSVTVGDPWDTRTLVGPVISERHRQSVLAHISNALSDGGTVLARGHEPQGTGWWVPPTLIGGLGNDARCNQEEIFGPVASVQVYDTVDEAIAIANDSTFGLHATVWGPHDEAMEIAPRLDVGQVSVNGGGPKRPDAPNGGWKNSGIGREFGEAGIREFLEPVHIQWPVR